jgi:hypothetical protein
MAPRAPAFHPPAARPAPQQRAVAPRAPAPQRVAPVQRSAPAVTHAPNANRAVQQQRQQRIQRTQQQRQQATPQGAISPQANQRQQQRQERVQRARENRELRHTPPAQRAQRREEIQRAREQRVQQRQQATPSQQAGTQQADPRQLRRQQRADQRQERTLRAREDRQLRRLPPAQRAQRREDIQHAREQRAQDRQQRQQALQNGGVRPNAAQRNALREARGPRRNGQARITPDAARQGRFASAFAGSAQAGDFRQRRFWHDPARRAWNRGHRAAFVAWFGPVFWPYAYSDIFDYTFWPSGYDDGYWASAYDDFFDSVFWGESGPPAEYVYGDDTPVGTVPPVSGGAPAAGGAPRPTYSSVQELCKQPGSGVTSWPIAEIESKVGLTNEQKELLAEMRNAGLKAGEVFKTSCPAQNAFPLTPPGRVQAMIVRLQATLEAVQTVRPALDQFYISLSDEQKERFNEIGPKQMRDGTTSQAFAPNPQSCKEQKPGLSNLPIEKIEDVVKPTDAQEDELNKLQAATDKAVSIMQAACPEDTPLTPPGRLEVMEKRLQAMIDAANIVKPALDSFYASLTSEQKARFNRIGRELAQSDQ